MAPQTPMKVDVLPDSDSDNFWGDSSDDEEYRTEANNLAETPNTSPIKIVASGTPSGRADKIGEAFQFLELDYPESDQTSPPPSPTKAPSSNVTVRRGRTSSSLIESASSELSEVRSPHLALYQKGKRLDDDPDTEEDQVSKMLMYPEIPPPRTRQNSASSRTNSSSSFSSGSWVIASNASSFVDLGQSSGSISGVNHRKRDTNSREPSPVKDEHLSKQRKTDSTILQFPQPQFCDVLMSSPQCKALPTPSDSMYDVFSAHPHPPPSTTADNPFDVPCAVPAPIVDLNTNTPKFEFPSTAPKKEPVPAVQPGILQGPFGLELDVGIIAHHPDIQKAMDAKNIAWGTQYECARGVSTGLWTWSDVSAKLADLTGPNAESAYRVSSTMRDKPLTSAPDLSIWEELDREQTAILENTGRGLGLQGAFRGDPDWHGGQIQQIARLVPNNNKPGDPFVVHLEPLEKRRSNRFARFLGSRRLLQVRVSKDLMMKQLDSVKKFFCRKFVLCGRVFVPFHAKDNGVYLVETDQDFDRGPGDIFGDQYRLPFDAFVQWHNPPSRNSRQPISKWSARWSLGLSNSLPAIEFADENIFYIPDIYASDWTPDQGKAPADKVMTDGCGFINGAALVMITKKFSYSSRPCAVQGRIAGAKGMWMLHPTDHDHMQPPRIWIRESQNKIDLPRPLDRAHRILDLLCASKPNGPTTLSTQSIINLSHNGVPDEVFISLMEQGLREEFKALTDWTKHNAMVDLWHAVEKVGHVSGARTQRLARGASRVLGLQGRDWGHEDEPVDSEIDSEPAIYSGRNNFSGNPLSLHESTVELLQSGFHPSSSKVVWENLKHIITLAIDASVKKFHIPVPESLEALVVPDPLGVLEEGQIYYRSSQPFVDPTTLACFYVLTGEVILGRYPIRLPADMGQVTAIDHPDLAPWVDVIIVSTKGTRAATNYFSGGDCDGDDLILFWSSLIVGGFDKTKSTFRPMPDDLVEANFEREVERVPDFDQRTGKLSPKKAQEEFQNVLLLGLADTKVGIYSNFHDVCVYTYGYDDLRTLRIADIGSTLLDSGKTGLRLKPEVFAKDSREFSRYYRPRCMEPIDSETTSGRFAPHRQKSLSEFVLDSLVVAGQEQRDNLLGEYDTLPASWQAKMYNNDPDLLRPYQEAKKAVLAIKEWSRDRALSSGTPLDTSLGDLYQDELTLLEKHVCEARKEYQSMYINLSRTSSTLSPTKRSPKKKSTLPAKAQDDKNYLVARQFAEGVGPLLTIPNLDEVKASYAYSLTANFGYAVAYRDLCLLKARASKGGIAPSTRIFDEAKKIPASYMRAMNVVRTNDETT